MIVFYTCDNYELEQLQIDNPHRSQHPLYAEITTEEFDRYQRVMAEFVGVQLWIQSLDLQSDISPTRGAAKCH